jgi:RNA recognition motif-containing protein
MEEKEDSEDKSLLNKKRHRSKDIQENHITKDKPKRKNRKRLLKNKLEFFLSDINLYHDTYLKKIYQENNSSISLEEFLSFNSIKVLLKDIKEDKDKNNILIKAVEISNKLIYDKTTNSIRRKYPYQENLINHELFDKCTIFIQNFPTIINHDIIYQLFKEYKILYIQLLKGKNKLYTGEAFITFKNEEDINKVIKEYNNSIPKLISELNPKVLKPLKIMTKEEYLKNKIIDNKDTNNNISEDNNKIKEKKISEIKNNNNIDENSLIKINNIKNDLSLNIAKKCIYNIVIPLFIDINKNEKSMILRFDSKKNSELFLSKIKEKNYEDIKDILEPSKEGNNDISINELLEKERKEYLDNVKMKIEKYKEKKENSKNCKENDKNE